MASSGCKFRKLQRTGIPQWSVTSFTKLRCAVQGTRGSVCQDKQSPASLGCTVKPSTTSAWVQVTLNPPGVDWRIVNYVHDGYIALSRCECNVAPFKPRSFCSAGGDSASHAISISLLSGLPACGQVPIAPCPLILRRVPSVLEQRTAACH